MKLILTLMIFKLNANIQQIMDSLLHTLNAEQGNSGMWRCIYRRRTFIFTHKNAGMYTVMDKDILLL